ncbi:MAG: hypothetical protein ACRDZ4_23500 [Egibacteraceae bacterium]
MLEQTTLRTHERPPTLPTALPILRTRFERVRNNRGEVEDRPVGLGILRENGEIEPLVDGALAERWAIKRAPHGKREQGE